MLQLHAMQPEDSKPLTDKSLNAPQCPTCQCVMVVKQVTPSRSMLGVGETVYVCDVCGTETHRAARRP